MQSIHETAKETQEAAGVAPTYDFTSKLVEAKAQAKVISGSFRGQCDFVVVFLIGVMAGRAGGDYV